MITKATYTSREHTAHLMRTWCDLLKTWRQPRKNVAPVSWKSHARLVRTRRPPHLETIPREFKDYSLRIQNCIHIPKTYSISSKSTIRNTSLLSQNNSAINTGFQAPGTQFIIRFLKHAYFSDYKHILRKDRKMQKFFPLYSKNLSLDIFRLKHYLLYIKLNYHMKKHLFFSYSLSFAQDIKEYVHNQKPALPTIPNGISSNFSTETKLWFLKEKERTFKHNLSVKPTWNIGALRETKARAIRSSTKTEWDFMWAVPKRTK